MVSFEEIASVDESSVPPSVERRLDAAEIEELLANISRPTARMHVEALIKKLRKESDALERLEASKANLENQTPVEVSTAQVSSVDTDDHGSEPAKPENSNPVSNKATSTNAVTSASPRPLSVGVKYVPIDRFSFDAGQYNSSHVTLYVPLPGVGSISRDLISCDFTSSSFDLIVKELSGKSYRLFKDDLEKDIDKSQSKFVVKADKIIIKLGKVKGEYGSYDYWTKLSDPKKRKKGPDGKREKEDPSASIMEMMKEMYDSGDDNMKKMIGETMLKQQRGELDREFGKKGYGGLGGLDDMDDI